jgi:hypothetical protein
MTNTVQLLRIALLQIIANTVASSMATDPQSLISAANVSGYNAAGMCSQSDLLELSLLQIIANNVSGGGGGGGGGVTTGNYGGSQPSFTPSSGAGVAIDTSNGRIWWYYSGAWH